MSQSNRFDYFCDKTFDMAQKPSVPKGTRDFLPSEMRRRNYLFDTIKKHFTLFGYTPIETPAIEKTETLLGKYGEEGDRLIFRILSRGAKLDKALEQSKVEKDRLSEEALKYDLTVPFARYVVQHRNELQFPFKRYQIQPVWRADRPQKGRYREFYQCDADVVGSDSLLFEVEFVQLFDRVLSDLGLTDFTVHINNRKILTGIAEVTCVKDRLVEMTVAIDKLDKIGKEGVINELQERGFGKEVIEKISPLFELVGSTEEKLRTMKSFLLDSKTGIQGVEEVEWVIRQAEELGIQNAEVNFEVTLARGLNYYTGCIFEVRVGHKVKMGSICGGGRYDDLTGLFGWEGLSGVGISFGADRIYDVLSELNLFPDTLLAGTRVLFINFSETSSLFSMKWVHKLRNNNVPAEVYPESAKMKKQMKYADDRNIPFVALAGDEEIEKNAVTLKNMKTGEQELVSWDQLLKRVE